MSQLTLISYLGAMAVCFTLFGGAFWLVEGLITDHVRPGLQRSVAMLVAALAVFIVVGWTFAMVTRHG